MSLGAMAIGTIISANAASQAKKNLKQAIDLPGVDINDVYGQTFSNAEKYLPRAQGISGSINSFNQDQLNAMLEKSIPGYSNIRNQQSGNIQNLLSGTIPDDVLAQIQRSSASRALQGGFGTGGARDSLTARDLGLTSLDLMNQGQGFANSLVGSTPLAPLNDVSKPLLNTSDVLGLRSKERTEKLGAITNWAQAPGATAVMGQGITAIGNKLFDTAASIGGSVAGGFCWVAREVFGPENVEWLEFRQWMVDEAPAWFVALYKRYGERFAAWISDKPKIKAAIRWWMRDRIASWKEMQLCQ